jgi:hypothetical protein
MSTTKLEVRKPEPGCGASAIAIAMAAITKPGSSAKSRKRERGTTTTQFGAERLITRSPDAIMPLGQYASPHIRHSLKKVSPELISVGVQLRAHD